MTGTVSGIAARLRTRREITGTPRKRVAHEIGVKERTLGCWERGDRSPTLSHAITWARALGAEIELVGA